ncbi:response regulator transcription factor [Zoogloea sp.]|uniref:response regulator n=1 Tax=Zoogloea sp. TaxID=49181 RepID=UPI0026163691|nr:response regulator transcription factor [Zoogloea sp.]MDD3353451.1 response regulator transcription factor [Zoogloea sp.]
MIRVLIADDHAVVRTGLRQVIATTLDISVAGEATRGDEVREKLLDTPADLLLLDMAMPGLCGVDLIRDLRARGVSQPILVLSMHNEEQIVARAFRAGANGYVTKGSEPEVLLAGIRQVAGGEPFTDPTVGNADPLTVTRPPQPAQRHETLSERERQVLQGIVAGLSLGEIAERLHLSPKTVSTHKMRLMDKLDIDNNADLIRYAIHNGLDEA